MAHNKNEVWFHNTFYPQMNNYTAKLSKRMTSTATHPALGSLTIRWSRFTVSMLCANTSNPECTRVSTAVKSPRKSEVKHSTMISGLSCCKRVV